MSKFDEFGNPYRADFEQGRDDGSQTNPYYTPLNRAGEALDAYTDGFKFGGECMDEYRDNPDDI